MRRKRKNPVQKSGLKNWLVLGGVGVGGFFIYRYFQSPAAAEIKNDIKAAGSKIPAPDLNGPVVTKFMIASTETKICISEPAAGMVYSPISSYNAKTGYNTFSATTNGHFTRRLLCKGNQKWAEIKPS